MRRPERHRIPPWPRLQSRAVAKSAAERPSLRTGAGTGLAHTDHEDYFTVGRGDRRFRLGNHRRAGGDRQSGKPGARDQFDRARADRWQVEAPILSGLRRLDQYADAGWRADAAEPPQFGNPRQHVIGALGGLDGDDVAVGHHSRLADIEWPERGNKLKRVADV